MLLAGLAIACAAFWPLPLRLDTHIAKELADPLLQAWQVAWGGHALSSQPFDYFQANTFFPLENSLAFSDALVGYSPAGLVGEGVTAALARYNLLFLLSYAIAGVGAYLLARELGLKPAAAAVAAAAFAYAPWRLEQTAHLHVISSGGIPLAMFLLLRGYRRRAPGTALAGWLVAAWQVSLGFTLGVPLVYGVGLALTVAFCMWVARGRPRLDRGLLSASAIGLAALALTSAVLAQPYLAVLDDHPRARRSLDEVAIFSPPPRSFASAPKDNLIWGEATAGIRDTLPWGPEQTLFPGLAIMLLAGFGGVRAPWPRTLRVGLLAAAAVLAFLSTGLRIADGWLGYRWLYELGPGWDGLRTPGRLNTFTSLALALLAAGGAQAMAMRVRDRRGKRGSAVALALAAVIVVEGSGTPPILRVPEPPPGLAAAPDPRLELPLPAAGDLADVSAFLYTLWSSDGFPRIMNGTSLAPRLLAELPERVQGFPDRSSVTYLRGLGVRAVTLRLAVAAGTPWADVGRRRAERLGVAVRREGGVVIYDLAPERSQIWAPASLQARR